MRWIFVCEVKLVKVSLITIILLFISQLKMSNMENDCGGDYDTDCLVLYTMMMQKRCKSVSSMPKPLN